MSLFLALLAQLLHLALMPAAALLLAGASPWMQARLAGRAGPGPLAGFRDQRRWFAKRLVRAEGAAGRAAAVPVIALAASLAAAALVPSFTAELAFAPLGDPLAVAGLLVLARLAEAMLTGADAFDLADPGLLLALAVAAMPGFGGAAWALAAAAAAVVVAARFAPGPAWPDGAGADFALLDLAIAVRRLVFLALLLDIVSPATAAGPEAWLGGFLLWSAEIAGLAALLALASTLLPRFTSRRVADCLAASILLAAMALLVTLATGRPP